MRKSNILKGLTVKIHEILIELEPVKNLVFERASKESMLFNKALLKEILNLLSADSSHYDVNSRLIHFLPGKGLRPFVTAYSKSQNIQAKQLSDFYGVDISVAHFYESAADFLALLQSSRAYEKSGQSALNIIEAIFNFVSATFSNAEKHSSIFVDKLLQLESEIRHLENYSNFLQKVLIGDGKELQKIQFELPLGTTKTSALKHIEFSLEIISEDIAALEQQMESLSFLNLKSSAESLWPIIIHHKDLGDISLESPKQLIKILELFLGEKFYVRDE